MRHSLSSAVIWTAFFLFITMSDQTVAFLACGTMGTAILSGVLDFRKAQKEGDQDASSDKDLVPLPEKYIATVRSEASQARLAKTFKEAGHNVEVLKESNVDAAKRADVVILCCKPYLASSFLEQDGMREALKGKLLVSILAGVTVRTLEELAPDARVVRAMTNTPSKIREGMTVISQMPESAADSDKALLNTFFTAVGRCRFVEEKYFDVCTALAGSGPAFTMMILEAMADGAVMMGLPRADALEMAAQTIQGAARMALDTGDHPAVIKDKVTTPGGCTIAGLLNMEDGNVRSTMARTIQTATQHAAGLGKK